jgi:hypothetical protein
MLHLADDIPDGLSYIPGSLSASTGEAHYEGRTILWSGALSFTSVMTLTYAALVEEAEEPTTISNTAVIDAGEYGVFTCSTTIVVDGISVYLPLCMVPTGIVYAFLCLEKRRLRPRAMQQGVGRS